MEGNNEAVEKNDSVSVKNSIAGSEDLLGSGQNGSKKSVNSTGKRKFHKKSKNGCDNCKRRRVKCDESKPFCKKCTHMKLTCVYSPAKPRKKKSNAQSNLGKDNNQSINQTNSSGTENNSVEETELSGNNSNNNDNSSILESQNDNKENQIPPKRGRKKTDSIKVNKLSKKKTKIPKNVTTNNATVNSNAAPAITLTAKVLSRQPSGSPYPFGEILQNQNSRQLQRQQPLLLPQFMTQSTSFSGQATQPSTPFSLNLSGNPSVSGTTASINNQFVEVPNPASPNFQSTGMTAVNSFSSIFSPGRIPNPLGQQQYLSSNSTTMASTNPNMLATNGNISNSFGVNPEALPLNKSKSIMSVGMNPSLSGSMNINAGLNMGLFSPAGFGGVNYDFQELLGLKYQPTNFNSRAANAEEALANMQQQHLELAKSRHPDNRFKTIPNLNTTSFTNGVRKSVMNLSPHEKYPSDQKAAVNSINNNKGVSTNDPMKRESEPGNIISSFTADATPTDLLNGDNIQTNMTETYSSQTAPASFQSVSVFKQNNQSNNLPSHVKNEAPSIINNSQHLPTANYNAATSVPRSNSVNIYKNLPQATTTSNQSPPTNKWAQLSQQSSLNVMDLKLFHHYCIEVWPTIIEAGISGKEVWSVYIPALALDHPFLMHSLLAFSATHLARTESGLDHYVSAHRIDALRLLREAILQLSDDNTDALVASAIILIMDSLANASTNNAAKNTYISPSAWIFHVRGAATILTAVWPLSETSKFYNLISMDLSGLGNFIQQNSDTISELVCFDQTIADLYPVDVDSPYLITLAYLDQLNQFKDQPDFILRIFAFPALLDKTFLALLMSGDLGAMRIMRSYYKLLRSYTTKVMDKVWFLEGVSQVLPQDVDEYSGGGGMHMMLDFLGGGLPSMSTTNFSEFIL